MKDNKKIVLIAIIVVISIIVLLGGVFAYIFLFTDLMKSEKQLFFKYTLENAEALQGIEIDPLESF